MTRYEVLEAKREILSNIPTPKAKKNMCVSIFFDHPTDSGFFYCATQNVFI